MESTISIPILPQITAQKTVGIFRATIHTLTHDGQRQDLIGFIVLNNTKVLMIIIATAPAVQEKLQL